MDLEATFGPEYALSKKREYLVKTLMSSNRYTCIAALLFLVCCLGASTSNASEQSKYGVGYLLENSEVRELFNAFLKTFGYLNDFEIFTEGRAQIGINAIIMDDVFPGNHVSPEVLRELPENMRSYIKDFGFENPEQACQVWQLITPDRSRNEAKEDPTDLVLRAFVVSDGKDATTEKQMTCLSLGMLLSFGYSIDELAEEASRSTHKEIFASILSGEIGPRSDLNEQLELWKSRSEGK